MSHVYFGSGDPLKPHYGERHHHLILAAGDDGFTEVEQRYVREALLTTLEPDATVHMFNFGEDNYFSYRNEDPACLHLPEVGIVHKPPLGEVVVVVGAGEDEESQ